MAVAFVFNRPYPAAPFSTLYLFGRGQDIGFEKAIDGSPRKRHHVRFWALNLERGDRQPRHSELSGATADRPPLDQPALWVGAGTRDTGFSLTAFTFQVTHATDDDTNAERDFIVGELKRSGDDRRCDLAPGGRSASKPGASTTMSPTANWRRRAWRRRAGETRQNPL